MGPSHDLHKDETVDMSALIVIICDPSSILLYYFIISCLMYLLHVFVHFVSDPETDIPGNDYFSYF